MNVNTDHVLAVFAYIVDAITCLVNSEIALAIPEYPVKTGQYKKLK